MDDSCLAWLRLSSASTRPLRWLWRRSTLFQRDAMLLAFTLVLIEALLSFGARGVIVCEGVLCVGIAAVGVYRKSLSPTGFAWRSLLTCVTLPLSSPPAC